MADTDATPTPRETPAQPASPGEPPVGEQAEPPTAEPVTGQQSEQKPARPGKSGRWLFWLIVLALLPVGWFLLPAQTRQHLTSALTSGVPASRTASEPPVSEPTTSTPPEEQPAEKAPTTSEPSSAPLAEPETPAAQQPAPAALPPTSGASSEEVRALMDEIRTLRGDLESLRSEARALRQSLRRQQELLLRDRLRRIADAGSRLSDMRAAWRDIGLLPMLDDDDRALARRMQAKAGHDLEQIATWRRQLETLAASLPEWKGRDIIPQPRQPALAWLAGKFHLRRAPSVDQRAQARLRARLLRAAHALDVQDWPSPGDWRHLLMDIREQFGDEAELKLPERLDETQGDIAAMRQSATDWLGRL